MYHMSMSHPFRFCWWAVLTLASHAAQAQRSFGGSPIALDSSLNAAVEAAVLRLPGVDVDALLEEDADQERSAIVASWRFGYAHSVRFDMEHHGVWSMLPNGDRLWCLRLHCPGAVSINIAFGTYRVPPGARVFITNDEGDHVGAFTADSHPGHTEMGIWPMLGERITVQYIEPASVAGQGALVIDQVTHGYRTPAAEQRDFGDSGPCHVNVACPEGDGWENEVRATARIMVGGLAHCSGTLLNNCANDGTPYFLTAKHCVDGQSPGLFLVQFNYQSPTCSPTQDGPTDQSIAGTTLLALSDSTDRALLLLNDEPLPEHNVYYAGWDATLSQSQTGVGIHHPSGDVKKISTYTQGAGAIELFDSWKVWHVYFWESGAIESGSSGSGLWDESHRLIGQLFGGQQYCDALFDAYYGRLDFQFDGLRPWLGECGTVLSGYDPAVGVSDGTGPNDPLKVWPVPADDLLFVDVPESTDHISLFDAFGRCVYEQRIVGGARHSLPTDGIPSGTYLLRLRMESDLYTRSVCVAH